MKTKFLIVALLLSAVAYSQTDREDKKGCKRIAAAHIKSLTQTAYQYNYDFNTRTWKQSTTGVKISTQVYDTRGNTVQEIDYTEQGSVDTKATNKYDARGNAIESDTYGSDGALQSKIVVKYNGDTMTSIKVYNSDGSLHHENYCIMKYDSIHSKDIYTAVTTLDDNRAKNIAYRVNNLYLYNAADSSLVAGQSWVYDNSGNLIESATGEYSKYNGKYSVDVVTREVNSYNSKDNKVEIDEYNKDNEWASFHKMKYNESGFLIEDQQRNSVTKYKNDAHGNVIEATMYDVDNGNPKTMYKYTYQYFQQ